MTDTVEIENAKELVQRSTAVNMRNTLVLIDGSNEVSIPGYPYKFIAKEDKILVSIDIFRSGYECRTCLGLMKLEKHCICEDADRPGFKYSTASVKEFNETLGASVAEERAKIQCSSCEGHYEEARQSITCPDCKGLGTLLHMPEDSKSLPTSGVIVSIGDEVDPKKGYKTGQRVLFGAYVGVMIPTKAPGIVFKILRHMEILCEIKGGEELASFDFVLQDKPL